MQLKYNVVVSVLLNVLISFDGLFSITAAVEEFTTKSRAENVWIKHCSV